MEHGDASRARRDAAATVRRRRQRLPMPVYNGMLKTLTESVMIAIESVAFNVTRTKVSRISRILHGLWRLAAVTYYAENAYVDLGRGECGLAIIKDTASRSQLKLSARPLLNMDRIRTQKPDNAMNAWTGRRQNGGKYTAEV